MEITKREKESESEESIMKKLNDYTTSVLKTLLRNKKLPTSGLKEDLIKRLLQASQQCPFETNKLNFILSKGGEKQASHQVDAMSLIHRKAELYRIEAELNLKEKQLAERELALVKKELKNVRQTQVNMNARTQEKSHSENRRSDTNTSVSKRDKSCIKQRTERERDQPKVLKRCLNCDQRNSEANCLPKCKDTKYNKYNKREDVIFKRYKHEEKRDTYATERPERSYFRRTIKTETPKHYCYQRLSRSTY
ncbi:PREDICTED: uncharacterized protein LOC108781216 [Cyphomyrmex costatus]|uniref:SAP domain-containing protein n=1 Tax=Cyphomyrmex costatus TaxID=456900 RepID=A0A151I8B7_9HYME|nr:PREDICTED: uncharacterized protein LOC108781216 [Cyphomyrmex costatus]KYM94559.1 hypothetical protein ALC62_14816 [Cyphomyrmex costatus]